MARILSQEIGIAETTHDTFFEWHKTVDPKDILLVVICMEDDASINLANCGKKKHTKFLSDRVDSY